MEGNNMLSHGICTSNEKGLFEVNFTIDTGLFGKLFKRKAEFKYSTKDLNNLIWESYANKCCMALEWFDEDGNEVEDSHTLVKIKSVLVQAKYSSYL
jgi:hypothetical protein